MLEKTQAIVIGVLPYTDSSFIVKLLTEKYGKLACIVRRGKSKSAKNKINLIQPGSILSVVLKIKQKSNIQQLVEYESAYNYNNIPFSPLKSSILLFLTEFINKAILEEENIDTSLFEFVKTSFIWFDLNNNQNFHLIFLIRLSQFLGFSPNINLELNNPEFYQNSNTIEVFEKVIKSEELIPEIDINSGKNRTEFLYVIIDYFNIHLPNQLKLKSLSVLKEVFS